jgi:hypothetical protein
MEQREYCSQFLHRDLDPDVDDSEYEIVEK